MLERSMFKKLKVRWKAEGLDTLPLHRPLDEKEGWISRASFLAFLCVQAHPDLLWVFPLQGNMIHSLQWGLSRT